MAHRKLEYGDWVRVYVPVDDIYLEGMVITFKEKPHLLAGNCELRHLGVSYTTPNAELVNDWLRRCLRVDYPHGAYQVQCIRSGYDGGFFVWRSRSQLKRIITVEERVARAVKNGIPESWARDWQVA